MQILAYKPGHDGHIVHIDDGRLAYSIEAEKDSGPRYGRIRPELLLRAFSHSPAMPDVIAVSGWAGKFRPVSDPIEAGYFGLGKQSIIERFQNWFGQEVRVFSSSHERSHLLCSYGLSPFPQGQACYALVWEGVLGAFYRIGEDLDIVRIGGPVEGPGHKYAFLYGLADPGLPEKGGISRREDAGKLMALAAYHDGSAPDEEQIALIQEILSLPSNNRWIEKAEFSQSRYCNIGLDSQEFRNLAWHFSDAVYKRFEAYARENMKERLPLLIGGGCGLNCDWNSHFKASGLFSDVFVPPCANDSGSAIGTAIDAQHHYTGNAKLNWTVYAGEEFIMDDTDLTGFSERPRDDREIASRLAAGQIFALVQGRYEIGPRALGNRSLIAAPFTSETHRRLNWIKQREAFRPIAPICLEDEADTYFQNQGPSPHMLYFQRLKTPDLKAVTHVDGTARIQTVNEAQNQAVFSLLNAFKESTGYGVLCNTSLNFKGTGFINRMSDLVSYARDRKLDGFIVNDRMYVPTDT